MQNSNKFDFLKKQFFNILAENEVVLMKSDLRTISIDFSTEMFPTAVSKEGFQH